MLRNRSYARGRAHVESYGSAPVIVYEPENGRHGNFFDAAYTAIAANPEWMRRFDKVHAQAARSLPKPQLDPTRRWRELDSSMSSDALLMNIFCTPGVADSAAVRNALGVDAEADPNLRLESARAACQWPLRPHRGGYALRFPAGRGKTHRSRLPNSRRRNRRSLSRFRHCLRPRLPAAR